MIHDYECDCCGVCCQGPLIVEAYGLDVLREPRVLNADVRGRIPSMEDLLAEDRCIVLAADTPCKFLGQDNRCTIYPPGPMFAWAWRPAMSSARRPGSAAACRRSIRYSLPNPEQRHQHA